MFQTKGRCKAMEFRLVYRGVLRAQSGEHKKNNKHKLRCEFHPQLKELWDHDPLSQLKDLMVTVTSPCCAIEQVGSFQFLPIVSSKIDTVCEIDVLFLRPSPPGQLIFRGGDLDNRIKRLFDGLRVPKLDELPSNAAPSCDKNPFHCLLQDDVLVTGFSVRSDRLLAPADPDFVVLIIHVKVKASKKSAFLMGAIE